MTARTAKIGDLSLSVSPTHGNPPADAQQADAPPHMMSTLTAATGPYKVSLNAKDTLWADTSYYQHNLIDFTRYPYWTWCCRSNDGTFDDPMWPQNYAKGVAALNNFGSVEAPHLASLALFGVYVVWRQNWQETVANLEAQIPYWHPRMWLLWDLESWGGAIRGNQSTGFRSAVMASAEWIAGKRKTSVATALKAVVGYANGGDRANLAPSWPAGLKYLLANYSNNTGPSHWAHQFSSSYNVPPFGPCDINSADGYTVPQLAASLGVTLPTSTPKPTQPVGAYHSYAAEGAKLLLSNDENLSLWLLPDGQLEIRQNHQHFAYVQTDRTAPGQ